MARISPNDSTGHTKRISSEKKATRLPGDSEPCDTAYAPASNTRPCTNLGARPSKPKKRARSRVCSSDVSWMSSDAAMNFASIVSRRPYALMTRTPCAASSICVVRSPI